MFASDRPSWKNSRVLSTLLMVFLAGALAGALTMQTYLHGKMHGKELSYETLKSDLHLNPRQAVQIKQILDDFVKYNQDLQAQIEDTRATGKNSIMSILDPDQKRDFEKICARAQDR